jgi:ankyrin repeat protein
VVTAPPTAPAFQPSTAGATPTGFPPFTPASRIEPGQQPFAPTFAPQPAPTSYFTITEPTAPTVRPRWRWKNVQSEQQPQTVLTTPKEVLISKQLLDALQSLKPILIQEQFKPTDIDKTDPEGNNPIALVILAYEQAPSDTNLRNAQQSIDFLLKAGNSLNIQNRANKSPLVLATETGKEKLVQFLLNRGAQIDYSVKAASNNRGYTELMAAAYNNHPNLVQLFLKAGAQVSTQNAQGLTPLMFGIKSGNAQIVQDILNQPGINVNMQDDTGMTALHYATLENKEPLVRLLLSKGANKTIANSFGKTPLAIAQENRLYNLIKLLS